MGWRYYIWTNGALMMVLFVLRVFVFHLYESPKYLMGRGRDAEAVEIVHKIAAYNGTTTSLTLDMLKEAETLAHESPLAPVADSDSEKEGKAAKAPMDTSARAAIVRKLRMLNADHVKALFATKKLAYSTSLLIITWGERAVVAFAALRLTYGPLIAFIGLAFPLSVFLSLYVFRGVDSLAIQLQRFRDRFPAIEGRRFR